MNDPGDLETYERDWGDEADNYRAIKQESELFDVEFQNRINRLNEPDLGLLDEEDDQ